MVKRLVIHDDDESIWWQVDPAASFRMCGNFPVFEYVDLFCRLWDHVTLSQIIPSVLSVALAASMCIKLKNDDG